MEVDPCVTGVSTARNGEIGVEPLEGDAHRVDYGGRAHGRTMARTTPRKANKRAIEAFLERVPGPGADLRSVTPRPVDFDWRPVPVEDVDRKRRDGDAYTPRSRIPRTRPPRSFRWSVLVTVIATGVGLALAFRFISTVPAQRAEEVIAEYSAAVDVVTTEAEEVLASTEPKLAGVDDLDAAVATMARLAGRDLPESLPLFPSGRLDELAPIRDQLDAAAEAAADATDRIRLATAYRIARPDVLALPRLPTSAPVELIDELAARIDEVGTATTAALAAIANDPAFTAVRADINETLFWLSTWKDPYLLAVRRGNTAEATLQEATARGRVEEVLADLDAVIASTRREAEAALEDVISQLEEVRMRLG